MGEGFIDYDAFFGALRDVDFRGSIAYEMCSPIRGGGRMENLDRYSRQFLTHMGGLPGRRASRDVISAPSTV